MKTGPWQKASKGKSSAAGLLVDSPQDADIILMLNTLGDSQGEAPLQATVRTVILLPGIFLSLQRPWVTTNPGVM